MTTFADIKNESQWQSQLLQFGIQLKDQSNGNEKWTKHANDVITTAYDMLNTLQLEIAELRALENAAK